MHIQLKIWWWMKNEDNDAYFASEWWFDGATWEFEPTKANAICKVEKC